MKVTPLSIEGVYEAQTQTLGDERGAFARLFCDADLSQAWGDRTIRQVNYSMNRDVGTLRGLHYQTPPHAEGKWIRCLAGRVFDVAVDLRAGSPTFLDWCAVELSAQEMNAIFIPEGCAHGFQVLEPDSLLLYLHSAAYEKSSEGAVRWDDPKVGIEWPLAPTTLSDRDQHHPLLADSFAGLDL